MDSGEGVALGGVIGDPGEDTGFIDVSGEGVLGGKGTVNATSEGSIIRICPAPPS
ncbi:hypothetical protein BT96DRAFT_924572 [Gymnopus androsaceus JB14]|uniref:Uncharacterized protein n=1 Tax=Gymnopus androsaceus JB14 TaxID=1447944 RepID=A0A6A4H3L5_9AGAR|nr:hypothetical protein BT96DRAFT_924569 [Gymnopus androsaceus JB14]KAE9392668.1 hypothetical protein BT96DRAFT_924572 [Gymnopus androsaceus JB14]